MVDRFPIAFVSEANGSLLPIRCHLLPKMATDPDRIRQTLDSGESCSEKEGHPRSEPGVPGEYWCGILGIDCKVSLGRLQF